MLGGRPVVMVFARKPNAALASLVKEIEKKVEENADKKLASFVNLLGDDREAAEAAAKKFVEANKVSKVAIAVPVEYENGPADFGINPKAEVTVMLYVGTKVKANHAFAEGKLDKAGIKAVIDDVAKILE